MNRTAFALGPALVLLTAFSVAAQSFSAAEIPETVVLKNGRVLRGVVVRIEDRLEITPSNQSVIRIPVKLVDFIATDLTTAYRHQSERLKDDDHDARLRLIDWCMRQNLLNEAAEQLAVIKYLAPEHPKLTYMTRRLELSRRLANSTPTPAPPRATSQVAVVERRRAATPAELTRFTKELPTGTVEQFTHVIQPMLVNRCGAATCHGVQGESEYQLIQPTLAGAFSHRYTQRNLYATVNQLREGNLADSAWIAAATRPHAGLKKPLFGEKEIDRLQQLVAWARTVGPAPKRLDAAAIAAAQLARPQRPRVRRDEGVQQATFQSFFGNGSGNNGSGNSGSGNSGSNPTPGRADPAGPHQTPASSNNKPAPTPPTTQGSDPFDPTPFNQNDR